MYFNSNMEYYVVSDLHGQGKIYDSIVNKLDNIVKTTHKQVTLIIDGDVIDRGPESMRMLLDIIDRVNHKKGLINVVMLPGNHEDMMLCAIEYLIEHREFDNHGTTVNNIWFSLDNHGSETWKDFVKLSTEDQSKIIKFLRSLPLYYVLKANKPNNNSYVIVHANPPSNALTSKNVPTLEMIVKDPKYSILRECLTYRKNEYNINDRISLEDKNVYTIIGHTPVNSDNGFELSENNQLLMIDGGCAYMAQNPNSNNILMKEMATLVNISEIPGKTNVELFGSVDQKELRQGIIKSLV